jgi:hypothetical protein
MNLCSLFETYLSGVPPFIENSGMKVSVALGSHRQQCYQGLSMGGRAQAMPSKKVNKIKVGTRSYHQFSVLTTPTLDHAAKRYQRSVNLGQATLNFCPLVFSIVIQTISMRQ